MITRIPAAPFAGVAISALLVGWVLWQLTITPRDASHFQLVLAWIVAFGIYALSMCRPRVPRSWRAGAWWRARRSTVLPVTALTCLALALRVWRLDSIPFVFSGDEAAFAFETLRVIDGEIGNPFSTGWWSMPTATFFFNSLSVSLLGDSPFALRLPWALVGSMTVAVTYCLAARLAGPAVGLVTAALLAVYHLHIHFSRVSLNNVGDPFFGALALLCLVRALDRRASADWLWTGAATGLALYGYPGARLILVIVLAVVAYQTFADRRRGKPSQPRGIAVALGAFLIVAAPMIQHAIRSPNEFNGRVKQVGILQNGWLASEVELRRESAAGVLFDQFQRAALAFTHYPDRTAHYGLRSPLLDPVSGAMLLLSMLYATFRTLRPPARPGLFPMVAWWWGGVIFGGMLTEPTPSSARLIGLTVPVCFFGAIALCATSGFVARRVRLSPRLLQACGVALFGVVSVHGYFMDFTPQRISGGRHAELATALGPVFQGLDPATSIHFAGAPQMFADFPTLRYFTRGLRVHEVAEPLTTPLPDEWFGTGRQSIFIFLPHRLNEMQALRAAFPHGRFDEIRSPREGDLIGAVYFVDTAETLGDRR